MRKTFSQTQISKINRASRIIGDQHNILILFELIKFGPKSFNELKRMTGINAVSLSRKLKMLEEEDIVSNRKAGILTEYYVNKKADKIRPIMEDIEELVSSKW